MNSPDSRSELELLFFFSSRRRHTRLQGDWSSDVCSSDLQLKGIIGDIEKANAPGADVLREHYESNFLAQPAEQLGGVKTTVANYLKYFTERSEERRVGKECRSRWSPYH